MAHTMLALLDTMARSTSLLALALLPAALLVPGVARAQTTTTTTGPVISATGALFPDRIDQNNVDLGTSTRQMNLNPLGINYDDCARNLILRFRISLSGFNGTGDSFQIWATNSGDCTNGITRGFTSASATCWMLDDVAGYNNDAAQTFTYDVHVRDIIGPQPGPLGAVPYPVGIAATQARGQALGLTACTGQPSFSAVPMSIWFLAVDSSGAVAGTPYQYGTSATPFTTDVIGPPAPTGVSEQVGDTLFIANWIPNSDSDTVGYDVFIDPIPGQENVVVGPSDATVLYCPESGAAASTDTGADEDGGDADDGSVEDAAADSASDAATSSADAACLYIHVGGPTIGNGGSCNDSVLSGAIVQDGGTVTTNVLDEAGDIVDSSVSNGSGGISTIPAANIYAPGSDGVTVPSNASGTYTIKGLLDGVTYNVAIAAVDGSGNIGPPSGEVCDFPAPVNDFWTLYRNSGGRAGGGFCALEAVGEPVPSAVGGGMILGAGALAMRRRRSRRTASATSSDAKKAPRR